jgi:hypothetical protein
MESIMHKLEEAMQVGEDIHTNQVLKHAKDWMLGAWECDRINLKETLPVMVYYLLFNAGKLDQIESKPRHLGSILLKKVRCCYNYPHFLFHVFI